MTPVDFPEAMVEFAKNQPEYQPLPAHVDDQGIVTSCWELTPAEICEIIKTKRIWLRSLTFGNALQPLLPQVEHPWTVSTPTPDDTSVVPAPTTNSAVEPDAPGG